MGYKFYGVDNCSCSPINNKYKGIDNPIDLYRALSDIWCEYTCAPRMREKWNKKNKTCGQCSITAFLVQDIFGGEVYGVALEDGNYHCYNVVGECLFDLTSEQFDKPLVYKKENPQSREVHFVKKEKYERYLYLKNQLKEYLSKQDV